MVNLSRETVEDFRRIIKEEYGVEYNDADAWEAAHNLVGFFDLLMRLDYEQKQKRKRNRRKDTD